MAAQSGDLDNAQKYASEAIEACLKYFDGNEQNESLIDPMII